MLPRRLSAPRTHQQRNPRLDKAPVSGLVDHGVHVRESVGRSAGTSDGRRRNSPRRRSRERHHQSHEILVRVPKNKDMMLAFSTAPHHVSIRNPRKGTCFLQSVAAVIAEHCHDTDLLRLMLCVNDMFSQI
uniref:CASPASE_P10 domain-containing protein n=1 Tax=Globodera pallida TaxID=36090 RepID=A0A183C7R9_GLOPA